MRIRKMKQKGRGTLESIATANKNLELINTFQKPKPPRQRLGQIVNLSGSGRKMRGGAALVDRYGAYVRNF